MKDLALDSTFDVFLDDRNEVSVVDGQDEFEQSVAIKLTAYMYNIPGDADFATLKEKIRLQVSRVARTHDRISDIDRVVISRHPSKQATIVIEIIYSSSGNFDFNLNI